MKIEIEYADNGAMLYYPEEGIKFVSKNKELAEDIGKDILAELSQKHPDNTKFELEISIKPCN